MDEEPVLPGETETTAALRLLERFHARMPRFLDVLAMDAFYLQASFAKRALDLGYGLVTILKQENRDLYQDADGLFEITESETLSLVNGTAEVWDVRVSPHGANSTVPSGSCENSRSTPSGSGWPSSGWSVK